MRSTGNRPSSVPTRIRIGHRIGSIFFRACSRSGAIRLRRSSGFSPGRDVRDRDAEEAHRRRSTQNRGVDRPPPDQVEHQVAAEAHAIDVDARLVDIRQGRDVVEHGDPVVDVGRLAGRDRLAHVAEIDPPVVGDDDDIPLLEEPLPDRPAGGATRPAGELLHPPAARVPMKHDHRRERPIALRLAQRRRDVETILRLDVDLLDRRVRLADHPDVLIVRELLAAGMFPDRRRGRERGGHDHERRGHSRSPSVVCISGSRSSRDGRVRRDTGIRRSESRSYQGPCSIAPSHGTDSRRTPSAAVARDDAQAGMSSLSVGAIRLQMQALPKSVLR